MTILAGNVFDTLPTIKPGSVDCCVTSPPYWMLRSYLPKGHALKPLELGSEKTPAEFVANMVKVFRLVRDCLADHAVCFINIGDTYNCGTTADAPPSSGTDVGRWQNPGEGRRRAKANNETGNLCLIPQRLAIALQDDGWIVRSIVIWHKPAPMPTSVSGWMWRRCRVKMATTPKDSPRYRNAKSINDDCIYPQTYDNTCTWADCPGCPKCEPNNGLVLRRGSWRPTSSYEPILMLAKSSKYFCDGEAVKQPPAAATVSRDQYTRILDDPDEQYAVAHDHETICNGANLRDVWTIAAEALSEKHYAAYPTELVRRCLMAGTSSKGYCPTCGAPWVRIIDESRLPRGDAFGVKTEMNGFDHGQAGMPYMETERKTIGFRPSCTCPPAEPRPGLVLDPFCGSGRTGITAQKLGLDFIGCELNPEYVEMANRLIYEDAPLFNMEAIR